MKNPLKLNSWIEYLVNSSNIRDNWVFEWMIENEK